MLILIYLKPYTVEVRVGYLVKWVWRKQSSPGSLHMLFFKDSLLNIYFYLSNGKYFCELSSWPPKK